MKKHNISRYLITLIEELYSNANSGVLIDNNINKWFMPSAGVCHGCLLSPCLFNLFLKQIMSDTLQNFTGTVSVAGWKFNNLHFADDIDLIAGTSKQLQELAKMLDKTANSYGMEISAEKSEVTTTSKITSSNVDVKIGNENLERARSFKYLGATIAEDLTTEKEVKARITIFTSQLTKLKKIWASRNITLKVN
ncbi:hypothetical protein Y1Q_0007752 [Alligator mississippiensis]|uniref:Reverse transcriptase domain-containing protein n=1 Tax=Alligator mississippiensis TaxID=8496 RepID=A0A151N725_ALLMI|nr:hypothetical protein Y1Q_0007752 [Alligator mississippiensis]